MDLIAVAGVCALLFVKESGLPGDLVVLSAGVAAASGEFDPAAGLVLIVLATIAGGIVWAFAADGSAAMAASEEIISSLFIRIGFLR